MILSVCEIMLYVKNPSESAEFWQNKVGFSVIDEFSAIGDTSYVIAPTVASDVNFVLHNKSFVARFSPEVNTDAPSLIFYTENINEVYNKLTNNDVSCTEIKDVGTAFLFNFSDPDGNWFVMKQVKENL